MNNEWPVKPLSEVIGLRRGFDLPNALRAEGPYPILSAGTQVGAHSEAKVKGPGFAVGRATNLGVPQWSDSDFWPLNTTLYAEDYKGNDARWLYRLFQVLDLSGFDSGSVQPMLNRNYIAQVPVAVPPLPVQRAIAEVLGALDDKIAANRGVLELAADVMRLTVEQAVDRGELRRLGDIAEFLNRRRIPLSKAQREARGGRVPYYGAAGRLDTVDEPIFEEPLVLVGEDGSVVTEDGRAVVQYIWGPAWVNNHAHVLRGAAVATSLLRWLLVRAEVRHLVTGAVQPKISMGNLKSLQVPTPRPQDKSRLERLCEAFATQERALRDANEALTQTRDELLPLLMSGKITVKDAEKTVEGVV